MQPSQSHTFYSYPGALTLTAEKHMAIKVMVMAIKVLIAALTS